MTRDQFLIYWFAGILNFCVSCQPARNLSPVKPGSRDTTKNKTLSERVTRLRLTELSGKPIHLIDSIGKSIFINFWASWCGPCKSEMASIEVVSKQFKEDVIFLLASDEDTLKIQNYLSSNHFDLHFIHMDIPFIEAYITELPTTFLIDKNGQLISEEEGFRIWTDAGNIEKLRKLLNEGKGR